MARDAAPPPTSTSCATVTPSRPSRSSWSASPITHASSTPRSAAARVASSSTTNAGIAIAATRKLARSPKRAEITASG